MQRPRAVNKKKIELFFKITQRQKFLKIVLYIYPEKILPG